MLILRPRYFHNICRNESHICIYECETTCIPIFLYITLCPGISYELLDLDLVKTYSLFNSPEAWSSFVNIVDSRKTCKSEFWKVSF
jgi:hypothetical protein